MVGNAPNTAYFQNAGTAKTLHEVAVSQENIFYVKFLSEYGTEENMKVLFYLDFLCERVKVKNADGSVEIGYWGGVYENSDNYLHHNPATKLSRKGLRVKDAGVVVKDIIVLNEPLNTRGHTAFGGMLTLFANYLRGTCTFLSAYYVPTMAYGFEFKLPADSVWTRVNMGANLPEKANANGVKRFIHSGIQPNTVYHVRLFIENAEGTYPTETYPVTTGPYIIEELFNVRSAACTATATDLTLFIPQDTRNGMSNLTETSTTYDYFAYKDADFNEAESGWYYSGNDGYSYSYTKGVGFTNRTLCEVVPTIKVQLSITVYSDYTYSVIANNISGGAFTSAVTITADVSALLGGNITGSFQVSVTIPASATSGTGSGTHTIDNVLSQDEWVVGNFSSSNTTVLANSEISGTAGAGS